MYTELGTIPSYPSCSTGLEFSFLLFLAKYRLGLALATWFSTMVQWKDKNTFAIKAHTNQGTAWSDLLDLFYFISNQHLYFYINKTKLG